MDNFSRIEDYLDELMTPSERAAFEADLQTDAALASDLMYLREARERLTQQWVNQEQENELVKIMKPLGKQHFGKSTRPLHKRLSYYLWGLAATIIAGFIVWLIWRRQAAQNPLTPPMLFAQHFRPSLDFDLSRSGEVDTLTQLQQAYEKGEFARVRALLFARSRDSTNGYNSFIFLQIGQLYLLDQQPDSARQALVKVRNGYSQQRDWYLALSALAANDSAQAKRILQRIAAAAGPFQAEAREILEDLK